MRARGVLSIQHINPPGGAKSYRRIALSLGSSQTSSTMSMALFPELSLASRYAPRINKALTGLVERRS